MEATFIIIREDLQLDPATIVTEGLLIGRLPTCELLLNHPSVSRLHAGITCAEAGSYYVRNLRPSNPILVNSEKLEEYDALAPGDVLAMGPFALDIDSNQGALVIKVSLQIAATPADTFRQREASGVWELATTHQLDIPSGGPEAAVDPHQKIQAGRKRKSAKESSKTLDVFWDKRITAATKTVRVSP